MRYLALSLACALLPACGTAKDALLDAAPHVDIDAPPADAATHGSLTVTTLDYVNNNAPVAGIAVVVINPDGSVAKDDVSDAQGKVTATIDVGATVTAVYKRVSGTTTTNTPITVYDAHPGDNIVIGSALLDSADDGSFTVTFPAYSAGYVYNVFGPCGSYNGATAGSPVTLYFRKNCHPTTFDVYVTATASGNTDPYYVMEKKGVSGGAINLANGIWASTNTFTSGYINIPSTITNISTQRRAGNEFGYSHGSNSGVPVNGIFGYTAYSQPRVGAGTLVETDYSRKVPAGIGYSQQGMVQFIDPNASAYNLDVGANLIPWIDAITFDKPTATMSSTLTGGGKYDESFNVVSYTAGGASVQWLALSPTADHVKLPTLPAHIGVNPPAAADTINGLTVYLISSEDFKGWDAVRQSPLDELVGLLNNSSTRSTAHFSLANSAGN